MDTEEIKTDDTGVEAPVEADTTDEAAADEAAA